MSARSCFIRKVTRGLVSQRAGREIIDALDETSSAKGVAAVLEREGASEEARQAAADVVARYMGKAQDQREALQRTAIAQANALRIHSTYETDVGNLAATSNAPLSIRLKKGVLPTIVSIANESNLYRAERSLLMRDPHEIAKWNNVDMLSIDIRGRAHHKIAEVIEALHPKKFGFDERMLDQLSLLRAIVDRDTSSPAGVRMAAAVKQTFDWLRDQHVAAGGRIPYREDFGLPNPPMDREKVVALKGADDTGGPFKEIVRAHIDRNKMLDWDTGLPLSDARLEQLLEEVFQGYRNRWAEGPPTSAYTGKRMLANQRDVARFFVWKNAESWQFIAENLGTHVSPFQTILDHIDGMAKDIAMMRTLGPNPEAWHRFVLSMFDREPKRMEKGAADFGGDLVKATKYNKMIGAQIASDRRHFEAAWAETTGLNDVPVNSEMARTFSDFRSILVSSQMGSAIVSSFTDPAMVVMTARWNGIPAMKVVTRAVADMMSTGGEIYAAQQDLIADSMAYTLGGMDKVMGETIRTGRLAKFGSAVIRAQGLRVWTAKLRNNLGLEFQAHVARERGKTFGDLEEDFRNALLRYDIQKGDWDIIRATPPSEERPKAFLTRPSDVPDQLVSEKFARWINTEMAYGVIERDPVARALWLGQSQPGTGSGEIRRGTSMYRQFATSMITMQGARTLARGWDGRRLSHGAITFVTMTSLGILALQAKQILAGKNPLSLDPTTGDGLRAFGGGLMQGGGLGIFADAFFIDQTRYGNSWAAVMAGPQFAAVETVAGDFIMKNIQKGVQGDFSTFAGDALYALGRITPGSNLWFARLAFQREVLDQLALMIDPRAPERFRRMEDTAKRDFNQTYFFPPGETRPTSAPSLFGGAP